MSGSQNLAVISQSVADTDLVCVGSAPQQAMSMTYLASANSMALVMSNAASTQQRGQVLAAACLSKVLALIIAAG